MKNIKRPHNYQTLATTNKKIEEIAFQFCFYNFQS